MAGTPRDIAYLEEKFQTNDFPQQQDFYDLFASFIHYLQLKQVTGSSTSDVMSQKAVTDALTALTRNLDQVLTAGNSAEGKRITNLLDPSGAQDADTKGARDSAVTSLANQLIDGAGAGDNTLKKLADKIAAINAIIGESTPDGDSLVDTVVELLAVFATYSEGVDIATLIGGKVNTADVYNALDQLIAGKVLDARQGKALKDLVDARVATADVYNALDQAAAGKVLDARQGKTLNDAKLDKKIAANRQTANYTLIINDEAKLVEMNVAGSNNLTVPPNSVVAFGVGTQILVAQYGAGQTTIVPGSGVTVRSEGGKMKISSRYAAVTLIKIAEDEWYLFGSLSI